MHSYHRGHKVLFITFKWHLFVLKISGMYFVEWWKLRPRYQYTLTGYQWEIKIRIKTGQLAHYCDEFHEINSYRIRQDNKLMVSREKSWTTAWLGIYILYIYCTISLPPFLLVNKYVVGQLLTSLHWKCCPLIH